MTGLVGSFRVSIAVMNPALTMKMTYDEYCLLPEDRNQYELIDGELIVTPSPTRRHQEIVGRLYSRLLVYVESQSLGEVYVAPLDTIFNKYTVLQPDILFVSRERLGEVAKERIEGAPDLVVEVLSPSTVDRDRRRKLAVYSQFGVREYWIVDPESRTMELYQRIGEGLQLTRQFSSGETFESQLLSGFRIGVPSLF
jgi:Uma2 family endonuclease